jgi:tetratricopeptide (TPR) repeat protein
LKQKDFVKAEESLEVLLDLNPTFPEAYYHGCLVKYNLNKLDEAIELINKAKKYPINNLSTINTAQILNLEAKF